MDDPPPPYSSIDMSKCAASYPPKNFDPAGPMPPAPPPHSHQYGATRYPAVPTAYDGEPGGPAPGRSYYPPPTSFEPQPQIFASPASFTRSLNYINSCKNWPLSNLMLTFRRLRRNDRPPGVAAADSEYRLVIEEGHLVSVHRPVLMCSDVFARSWYSGAQSTRHRGFASYGSHIVLSCFVICCCGPGGFMCGLLAFCVASMLNGC